MMQAKRANSVYYPPTYKADGFTHMTADPTKLVDVLNHFYKQDAGDWVCLKTDADTLRGAGIELTFEETAPVRDIEVRNPCRLFPEAFIVGALNTSEEAWFLKILGKYRI